MCMIVVNVGHLSVVSLEVGGVLKVESGEDLNEVCVGCCKQVTSVTEGTLSERRQRETLKREIVS